MKFLGKAGGRELNGLQSMNKKKLLKIESTVYIHYSFVAKHLQCCTPKDKIASLKISF